MNFRSYSVTPGARVRRREWMVFCTVLVTVSTFVAGTAGLLRPRQDEGPAPATADPARPRAGVPVSEPPPVSYTAIDSARAILEREIVRGAFPGATFAVGRGDKIVHLSGTGHIEWHASASPADPDSTVYDLASLSKVMATATAVMLLVEDGRLKLTDPVQRYLPGFQGQWKEDVNIWHLLTHSSGLPQGTVLRGESPRDVLRRLQRTRVYLPPGTRYEYSDIGYAILWAAAEKAAGEPLPKLLKRRVYGPLGMHSTGFLPGEDCTRCAPTLHLEQPAMPYRGRPSDITARRLGGIAGNAGLFSTAHDVARFAAMITNGGELNGVRIFKPETIALFTRTPVAGERPRPIGWQLFCRTDTLEDPPPCTEPYAFGHTGYSGTSLWIDRERGAWVVLLTNRTYLPRASSRMPAIRRRIFGIITGRTPDDS